MSDENSRRQREVGQEPPPLDPKEEYQRARDKHGYGIFALVFGGAVVRYPARRLDGFLQLAGLARTARSDQLQFSYDAAGCGTHCFG